MGQFGPGGHLLGRRLQLLDRQAAALSGVAGLGGDTGQRDEHIGPTFGRFSGLGVVPQCGQPGGQVRPQVHRLRSQLAGHRSRTDQQRRLALQVLAVDQGLAQVDLQPGIFEAKAYGVERRCVTRFDTPVQQTQRFGIACRRLQLQQSALGRPQVLMGVGQRRGRALAGLGQARPGPAAGRAA